MKKEFPSEELKDLISQLKTFCICNKIPMFISFAVENTESGTVYLNDCVFASLERNLTDNRIAKLLMLTNGASLEYPPYIKKSISDLTEYLEKTDLVRKHDALDITLSDDKLHSMMRVGEGLMTTSVPNEILKKSYTDTNIDDLDELSDLNDL